MRPPTFLACLIVCVAGTVLAAPSNTAAPKEASDLPPPTIRSGERFSNHFKLLLRIVTGSYKLSYKSKEHTIHPAKLSGEAAKFLAKLTRSRDPDLKRLALA